MKIFQLLLLIVTSFFLYSSEDEPSIKKQKLSHVQNNEIALYECVPFDNSDYVTSSTSDKSFLKAINGAIFFLMKVKKQTNDPQSIEVFDIVIDKIKTCKLPVLKEVIVLLEEFHKNEDLDEQIKNSINQGCVCLKSIFKKLTSEASNAINEGNFAEVLSEIVLSYLNPGQYQEIFSIEHSKAKQAVLFDNCKKLITLSDDLIKIWDLEYGTLINERNVEECRWYNEAYSGGVLAMCKRAEFKLFRIKPDENYIAVVIRFSAQESYLIGKCSINKIIIFDKSLNLVCMYHFESDFVNLTWSLNENFLYGRESWSTNGGYQKLELVDSSNSKKLIMLEKKVTTQGDGSLSTDGNKEVCSLNNKVLITDLNSMITTTLPFNLSQHAWSADCTRLALSTYNTYVYSGGSMESNTTNNVVIWNCNSYLKTIKFPIKNTDNWYIYHPRCNVEWSPDGKYVAVGMTTDIVSLFDATTGNELPGSEFENLNIDEVRNVEIKWLFNQMFLAITCHNEETGKDIVKIYGKTLG
ncbi:MAG: hypothetical protein P4L22_03305 [Candidatus Babeliales bacterium]|nr:hypothetical protein [Candidatus Babeliales bacterium]